MKAKWNRIFSSLLSTRKHPRILQVTYFEGPAATGSKRVKENVWTQRTDCQLLILCVVLQSVPVLKGRFPVTVVRGFLGSWNYLFNGRLDLLIILLSVKLSVPKRSFTATSTSTSASGPSANSTKHPQARGWSWPTAFKQREEISPHFGNFVASQGRRGSFEFNDPFIVHVNVPSRPGWMTDWGNYRSRRATEVTPGRADKEVNCLVAFGNYYYLDNFLVHTSRHGPFDSDKWVGHVGGVGDVRMGQSVAQ